MPKKISLELEAYIRGLVTSGMSYRQVSKHLMGQGVSVHYSSIGRVINSQGKERQARLKGKEFRRRNNRPVRTKELVKKIKARTSGKNTKPIKQIAIDLKVSRRTVQRVIYDDLQLKKRSKRKVHVLTESNRENRTRNSKLLYQSICGQQSEFAVTLDEAIFQFIPGNHESDVIFIKKGEDIPQDFVKQVNQVQPPRVMVVAGITGRGPLKARIVPQKSKVNAEYYVKHVLQPIIETELVSLYPGEMHKVFLHHDKAPSHISRKTYQFLEQMHEKYGIWYQDKEDVVVKGADCSSMDFFGFGWLKHKVKERRVRTLEGMCKAIKQCWSELSVETCQNVFQGWKRRCRMINQVKGKHIEQIKNIHSRKN